MHLNLYTWLKWQRKTPQYFLFNQRNSMLDIERNGNLLDKLLFLKLHLIV